MKLRKLCIGLMVMVMVLMVVVMGGCSGVWMNAEYSQLLDETEALSTESARRAEAAEFTTEQMVEALKMQASVWGRFQDARDGQKGGD